MSNVLIKIKELVSFYVKINYEEYLKTNKIDEIEESKIKGIIEDMFDERKEHLKEFVKKTLKEIFETGETEEYPGDSNVDKIFSEILNDRDFCITKLTTEIKLYQKNK